MRIDWWTLALQAINVLILIWLLGRFLFRPVMDAIAARQGAADALLTDAQKAKDDALAETAALKVRNAGFAAEAADRRTAMQALVETERAQLMAQAKQDADGLADQVRATAAAERVRMSAQLEQQAGQLAIQIAGKLLARVQPAESDARMRDALLDRIGALSEDERRKLAADATLMISTPAPLDEAARAGMLDALKHVLPGLDTLFFTVDPALIMGCELRAEHMRVRNSWRADLDEVAASLREDDHAG